MSSYFDNQYGGEDPDDTFGGGASDDDKSSSSDTDIEDEQEGGEDIEEEELEGGGEEEEDEEDEEEEDDEEEDDDQEGGAESELEEGEIDEEAEAAEKKAKKIKKVPAKNVYKKPIDFIDDDDNDDDGEQYLQKFDQSVNDNYVLNFHPESVLQNYDEILSMTKVVRNSDGVIIDKLHRTIPYLTKYEKARILGQRAKQLNSGAYPFVKVPENVIDGYIIAEMELKQKRIPFIIRRPLPNGGSEYWRVQDLEDISF
jgi:DNA-directed RNA polymerase I, II, and III subunit RPABC2